MECPRFPQYGVPQPQLGTETRNRAHGRTSKGAVRSRSPQVLPNRLRKALVSLPERSDFSVGRLDLEAFSSSI
jgi:hypothetical protein